MPDKIEYGFSIQKVGWFRWELIANFKYGGYTIDHYWSKTNAQRACDLLNLWFTELPERKRFEVEYEDLLKDVQFIIHLP